jgi:hypothetical protein
MGHGADVPDVVEDVARIADQERGKLAVVIPGAADRAFVNFFAFFVEEQRDRRNVGLSTVKAHIALALLFGIIKRVCVKKRPDKLSADVFQPEFKMRVLVDGVVAAVKRGGADVEALLVGDFFRRDQARRVASARGGNGGVKRVGERIAESDARRGGFHKFARTRAVKHARLRSHVGKVFYTGAKDLTERTRASSSFGTLAGKSLRQPFSPGMAR